MDDDFVPEAVPLTHVMIAYAELLTRLYGGRSGWLRQAGEPINNMFLTDEEIEILLNPHAFAQPVNRARAVCFWAGVAVPTERERTYKDHRGHTKTMKVGPNSEALGWHVLALQTLYHHPEYW